MLTTLINAFKSLLLIGPDILHDLISILMRLFKFAVKALNATLNQPLTFPGLSQIYEYLMDGEPCTLVSIFSHRCCTIYTTLQSHHEPSPVLQPISHHTSPPAKGPPLHLLPLLLTNSAPKQEKDTLVGVSTVLSTVTGMLSRSKLSPDFVTRDVCAIISLACGISSVS